MRLITELNEDVEYITEATGDSKNHFITGIFMQANLKNKNGRIYPMEVLEGEVNRYIKDVVEAKRGFGELGHPQGPQINLERVSHLITELKRDGDNFIGKARIATDTPAGATALGLLTCGASLGVSSRALGTLKALKSGIMEVQSDLKISTAGDIVADPSAPHAFVKGIMENVEWFYDASKDTYFQEQLSDSKKTMRTMTNRQLEEKAELLFDRYLSTLKNL